MQTGMEITKPSGAGTASTDSVVMFLLVALLVAGCNKVEQRPVALTNLPEPCSIALASYPGETKTDQETARLQRRAREATDPLPYLERIGWLFIAKARETFDPGYYKLAESCALCMESKKPQNLEAMLLRGHVLHSLHRFKDSETIARALVAKRGLSFDYGLLGDALMEQGKLTEAVDAYQKMIDQKPGPEAYSRAAHMRWLKGDLDGAIALMQLATDATGSGTPESAAWFRVRLALYELQANHLEQSVRLIEAALLLEPNYPPALLARGRLLLAQGEPADAVETLERAAELNPLPEYHWVLLEALQTSGRTQEAERIAGQLQQRGAADDPRTYSLYLATRGEDTTVALRLAREELSTRADVFTLDAVAWAERAAGEMQQAYEFSQRALAEGTEDARLFLHAALIAQAAGNHEQAMHWLAKASALEQMLLPSEKEALVALQNASPVLVNFHSP